MAHDAVSAIAIQETTTTERVSCQNITANLQRDDAARLATFQTSPQAWHLHAVSTVIIFARVPTAFDPHSGHAAGRCAGSWFTGCIAAPPSQGLPVNRNVGESLRT
jgi:hypothetical protein